MKKSLLLITILLIISCVCGCGTSEDTRFNEVAQICNDLGGLPGMQIASPKVENVWYFCEEDNSGKDVIVCFNVSNSSSKYYQYFMCDGEGAKFINMAYAKDEVNASNISIIPFFSTIFLSKKLYQLR